MKKHLEAVVWLIWPEWDQVAELVARAGVQEQEGGHAVPRACTREAVSVA